MQNQAVRYDAVIVGAGFAGLYMLHKLRGLGLKVRVLEKGQGVGGTWYWNRYPGARCDVESYEYSFSFDKHLQQEWSWTERYATQPEILSYATHVARRFDLERDIEFDTEVSAARFDRDTQHWTIETSNSVFVGRYFILATGCLSSPNWPAIPGLDQFAGDVFHTGYWPHHTVYFEGKSVAVIGTGSSAVQSIPQIARKARQVTVFQRTANFAVPAHNKIWSDDEIADIKSNYDQLRAQSLTRRTYVNYEVNPQVSVGGQRCRAPGRILAALEPWWPRFCRCLRRPDPEY